MADELLDQDKENQLNQEAATDTPQEEGIGSKGAFIDALKRNNKKIREDRAIAISEGAQILYKRTVEDMRMEIKTLERKRANMLDLSPIHADDLMPASNFKPEDFVKEDLSTSMNIRNLRIKLDLAERRYKELFGEEVK